MDENLMRGHMVRAEPIMDGFRKDIKTMKDKMRLIDDMLEFGVDLKFVVCVWDDQLV